MLRHYVTKNGKTLRCGYTTGACAAAAAGAAARMLLCGDAPTTWALNTPKGVPLELDILEAERGSDCARCAVRKDGGDDPDVTDGVLVCATVRKIDAGICIDGGEGVGRVTKPGLDQPVGAAAINSVPRRMIAEQIEAVCASAGYTGGLSVVVSIPGGEALARRTFNPRLGVEGGLSVIGTTGIVEPMSSAALVDTVRLELNVLRQSGAKGAVLCPGNYGETFAREKLGLSDAGIVTVGNFIGDAVDAAVAAGFERVLLVGHVGKLVKLGIGARNTHSENGDGRMETLAACALAVGADADLARRILDCATTDAALAALDGAGLLKPAMTELGARIQATLERWTPERVSIGFISFANREPFDGALTQSDNAYALVDALKAQ